MKKLSALHHLCALLPALLLLFLPSQSLAAASGIDEGVKLLSSKKFSDKEKGIAAIGASGDEKAQQILSELLGGKLFFTKKDKVLVYGDKKGREYEIINVYTNESMGVVKKRLLKKITINNKLRTKIKQTLALINLTHSDPKTRAAAVQGILPKLTDDMHPMLSDLLKTEEDKNVRELLETSLALIGLKAEDTDKKEAALTKLQGNLNPVVRNEITTFIEKEENGGLQKKAKQVLVSIDSKRAWFARLETIFFGMSLGSVLVLAAIGLAITFGVIGVINMAHGELIMLGAYTTYVIQLLLPNSIGWALAISVPAAFCVSGIVGIIIEKSVIRFLYGRPLETLLATFGISLILQQAVRTIFSPLNRSVSTPDWMSGSIAINPVLSLTTNRVAIFIFAMAVFFALYLLLKRSSLGLQVRAVSQNRAMARAMGVRASRVDALTFGLGSGIAGIAGVALSQLTNVGPNLGQAYIVDSFMVVVFGGVGNLWGTLLGGLSLGVANKLLEPWSGAVLAKIIILIGIILFIQKRPQGLFPQRGRAAE